MGKPSYPCFRSSVPYAQYTEISTVTTLPPYDLDFFILPQINVPCPPRTSEYKFNSIYKDITNFYKVSDIAISASFCEPFTLDLAGADKDFFKISGSGLYFTCNNAPTRLYNVSVITKNLLLHTVGGVNFSLDNICVTTSTTSPPPTTTSTSTTGTSTSTTGTSTSTTGTSTSTSTSTSTTSGPCDLAQAIINACDGIIGITLKYCITSESLCIVHCQTAPWCEECVQDSAGTFCPEDYPFYSLYTDLCSETFGDCIFGNCGYPPNGEPGCHYMPGTITS